MTLEEKKQLIQKISQSLTEERNLKMRRVVTQRTNYVTVVLEDIYQVHNASAVLRSCDGFGIQNVHIIEQEFIFRPCEGVSKGAGKWLNLLRYNSPGENNSKKCFDHLRKTGYTIAATTPHKNDLLIQDLPVDKPVALVFGTEQKGLSEFAMANADIFVKIPLHGFVESYNIAVSAAICIYEAVKKAREYTTTWGLNEEEQVNLLLDWLLKTTPHGQKAVEDM